MEELEKLCKGLVCISETDAAVEAFQGSIGFSKAAKISEAGFYAWMDNQVRMNQNDGEETEDSRKWRALFDFMTEHLTNPAIVKVGEVDIDVYGFGYCNGNLYGFKTKVVET